MADRQSLCERWHSEHGWVTIHVCGADQTIGQPLRGITWDAMDTFMSSFRWKVIGTATDEEVKSMREFLGTGISLPYSRPVYKIEAMD